MKISKEFRCFWIILCSSYLVDLTNSVSEQISVYVPPPINKESSLSSSSSSYPYAFDLHGQESQNYASEDDELASVVPMEADDYILRYEDDDVGVQQGLPLPVADFDDDSGFYPIYVEEFSSEVGGSKGELSILNEIRRRRSYPYDHWMGTDDDDYIGGHDDNGWDDSDYPYGYGGYNKNFGKYKGKKYESRRKTWDYSNYNQYPHYKYSHHPLEKYGHSHSLPKIKHEYHKYDEEDDYLHPLDKYSNDEYPYPKISAGLSAKYHLLKHKFAAKNHHHHNYGW